MLCPIHGVFRTTPVPVPKAPAAGGSALSSVRELLQSLADSNGLPFMPKAGRTTDNGDQVSSPRPFAAAAPPPSTTDQPTNQHTNQPTHQHTNTPTHQLTNQPTNQNYTHTHTQLAPSSTTRRPSTQCLHFTRFLVNSGFRPCGGVSVFGLQLYIFGKLSLYIQQGVVFTRKARGGAYSPVSVDALPNMAR